MWLDEDIGERARLPSWIEEFGADAFERGAPAGRFGFSEHAWFLAPTNHPSLYCPPCRGVA